jgi:type I site-specific restriction endonuclease
MKKNESIFGPVIHAYTRKQAIADGVQIDVTKTAKEAESVFRCS